MVAIPIKWFLITGVGPLLFERRIDLPVLVYSEGAQSIIMVSKGDRVMISMFEVASDESKEAILPKTVELATELAKVGVRELGPGAVYGITVNLETIPYAEKDGSRGAIYIQRMGMAYAAHEFILEDQLMSNFELSRLEVSPPVEIEL